MAPRAVPDRRRSWAGIPADERRAGRKRQLLDAAFELLGTVGAAGTTVRSVCRAAGLNTRYFYESFDDIDALLVAVYDHTVAQLYRNLTAADDSAGSDPMARMRAGIDAAVAYVDEDRRRGRVLFVEARGNPAVDRHRTVAWRALIDSVAVGREPPPGESRRRRAVGLGQVQAEMFVGGFTSLLVEWLSGRLKIDKEQLITDATLVGLQIAGVGERRQ